MTPSASNPGGDDWQRALAARYPLARSVWFECFGGWLATPQRRGVYGRRPSAMQRSAWGPANISTVRPAPLSSAVTSSCARGRQHAEAPESPVGSGRRRELPQCLDDDREDNRLDAPEEPGRLGQRPEPNVSPREGARQQCGGHDEAHAGYQESRPTPAIPADVDGHLRRVRTRDEVRRAEEVQEPLVGHPHAPVDNLVAHHRDMRRRSSKGRRAEPQEQDRELDERRARRSGPMSFGVVRRHTSHRRT